MNQLKSVMWVIARLLVVSLLLLLGSNSALAQVTASITGRIQDSSGAAVPEAMVTVKNLETGVNRSVATDAEGSYRALSLAVGRYEVKAEKSGFKATVQTGINLAVGQEAVVNLAMEVGQVQQQVTVTAEAPVVNTTTSAISGLVDEKEVKELPLNGRSFDNLIALNTGAIPVTSLKNAGANAQSGNLFSVSGRRYYDNLFLMNGVEYVGPTQQHSVPGGVSGQLLGIDAVREFNVQTDTYGAEYGKRSGGQVSVVTQSGSNALHGSLFEFIRNSALDARNFFDQGYLVGAGRLPPLKRNQFGGSLGGPIRKDKTFVFGNYEGFRYRVGLSSVSFAPDNNARDGKLPCNVVNPTGAGCAGNSKTDTTPTLVPGSAAMLPYVRAYWPVVNGPILGGGVGEAIYNPLQSIREDFGIVRVDHNFSSKDTLGANYLIDDGINLNPQANPLWHQDQQLRSQVLSLQETHIFTPSVINTATVGYSRSAYIYANPPAPGYTPSVSPLIPGRLWESLRVGNGGSSSGGSVTAGGATIISNANNFRNVFTYADSLQVIQGRHQLSMGVWFQRLQSNDYEPQNPTGVATFGTLLTLLQGTLQTFSVAPITNAMYWRQLEGAWFVQDNIQLRPNLSIRIGLRHEFNDGWNTPKNNASNYDFTNGAYQTIATVGSTPYTDNNAKFLFGPRVGLAWDPFGKGKMSVRAGFGTYYTMIDTLANSLDHNPPTNGVLTYPSGTAFLSLFAPNAIPLTSELPQCTVAGQGVANGCGTYAPGGVEPNLKTPTVEEWNLAVEQAITPNMSIRVAYVGSHGFHLDDSGNPNTIAPVICATATCVSGGFPGVASAAKRSIVAQGASYVPVQGVPNPLLGVGATIGSYGVSSYNALNVELTRRFSSGLQFKTNYTWSRELDIEDGYSGDPGVGQPQDFWNQLQSGWGPSGDNQTHRFVFAGGYELPLGKNKPFLNNLSGYKNKLVSGWQVNSIVTVLSGYPFSATDAVNQAGEANQGTGTDRPSYAPGRNASNAVIANLNDPGGVRWLDPTAFTLPTNCVDTNTSTLLHVTPTAATPCFGVFGNVGKNTFIGPHLREFDLSIFKTTTITERLSAQFRFEGFNIFNHTNFSNPTSGSQAIFSGSTVSGSAGLITATATDPRRLQFGLKLIF